MSEKQPFLRAAGLVGAIIVCSRVLGLVRDMVLSACFGATRMGDLFLVAFELPNLVRRVLGEGSLSAFVVPIVTKVRSEEGEEKAWRFASNALTVLAALSL
ncbi:MAG TPA: lipid II flippase MurJ, partial [Sumerlaeia bacterium]|nr:lipid II flippase MurJ [Sumerlaeia bacterium]